MKWAYSVSSYAKLYEKYCKENLPSEADDIFKKADEYYREFMRRDMPDLGKNMMAANMYDWFTIISFYEASDHRLDGEVLLTIKRESTEKMKFLGKIVNGNKSNWPYKVFEKSSSGCRKSIRQRENGWIAGKLRSTQMAGLKGSASI